MGVSTTTENDIYQLRYSRYDEGSRDQLSCMIGIELHHMLSFNGITQLS